VSYCSTWYLTLREEHRLRLFENRVLRRIFGPKRDEVTGDLRKLYNEEATNISGHLYRFCLVGWCNDNVVDLYLGGARFDSR
jgi:hypothetical protein